MKKTLSLLLAFVLMLGLSAVPALADDNMQQVLASVKARIAPTDGFDSFNSYISNESGDVTYNFYWETTGDAGYKSMNITALQDATITQYSYYGDDIEDSNTASLRKHTRVEALEKVKEYFKKLNPVLSEHVEITNAQNSENLDNSSFSFEVKRVENGVEVKNDNGYISLASDLGKITDFYISYTQGVDFKNPKNVIGSDAAKKAFAEKIGMKLVYQTKYNYDEKTKSAYSVYVPTSEDTYIDAFTGDVHKALHSDYFPYRMNAMLSSGGASEDMEEKMFSEAEQLELDTIAGLISIDSIEKALRANKLLNITGKMKCSSYNLYKDSYESDKYLYSINFWDENEDDNAQLIVNAKTGEINSFNHYYNYDDNNKMNTDKAKAIALKAAAELAPTHIKADGTGDYILDESTSIDDYSYLFTRMVNSVPVADDCIYVSLNPADGKISSYTYSFSNIDFPSVENCLTSQQACEKLIEYRGMELAYIPEKNEDTLDKYSERADKMTLVYTPDDSKTWIINAENGKPDESEETEIPDYTDISGHYGENAINTLKSYGVGFKTAQLDPDKPITQKEFGNLCVNVLRWRCPVIIDDEDVKDYTYAEREGILGKGEKASDRSITRLEAATYIIRALNIEEYAMLKGIYVSPFDDVPEESIGITAMLSAMNVINSTNGSFNPNAMLSRADAMIMIYNYLNRE